MHITYIYTTIYNISYSWKDVPRLEKRRIDLNEWLQEAVCLPLTWEKQIECIKIDYIATKLTKCNGHVPEEPLVQAISDLTTKEKEDFIHMKKIIIRTKNTIAQFLVDI